MYQNEISFRLHALVYSIDKIANQVLREHGSNTFPQFLVVLCVYTNPHSTQKFIADWLQITEATVCFTVKRLVAAGLIHVEADPNDLRTKRLTATSSGIKFIESVYPKLDQAIAPHYSKLTPKQLSDLMNSISILQTSINKGECV